jgi:hypothetical protein
VSIMAAEARFQGLFGVQRLQAQCFAKTDFEMADI